MQEVHVLLADLGEVVDALDLHRLRLNPLAVFPIASLRRNLADVDLGIEVRRKRIAVIARVAVKNVDVVDLIEVMLQGVSGKDARDARIEARAEQRRDAGFLEAVIVLPLPFVFKLRRVLRLVVRRIDVMRLRRKARVHDCQILVRQCEIQDDIGLLPLNQGDELVRLVRIHLRRRDFRLAARELFLQCVALCLRAARNADFLKGVAVLAALVHGDACDAARADDQSLSHDFPPVVNSRAFAARIKLSLHRESPVLPKREASL